MATDRKLGRLATWDVEITDLGLRGLTYRGRAAHATQNGARMLVVAELRRVGVIVPRGAIVRCERTAGPAAPVAELGLRPRLVGVK